mmetsp:Transcript_84407/g.212924  ORF Transcript_84407/g.212924 Transcript_84407/m.212924 type:complete len:298 (-) Transcript_84407:311-1204(-)
MAVSQPMQMPLADGCVSKLTAEDERPSRPVPPDGPRPQNLPSRHRPAKAATGGNPAVGVDSAAISSVEVYSAEDCCSKCIEGLCETSTLASLVERAKYEFAIPESGRLNLAFGDRQFGQDDLLKHLGDLGVREGSILSFEMRQSELFDVAVTSLAGQRFVVKSLMPELRLGELVSLAEEAMSLHDEEASLIMGSQALVDMSRTLGELGIGSGCELMALKRLRPRGTCPTCCSGISASCDVTIGATHEGWGRRWNRCQYNCKRCGSEILHGEPVNACHRCKCFWHRSCKLAHLPATSC